MKQEYLLQNKIKFQRDRNEGIVDMRYDRHETPSQEYYGLPSSIALNDRSISESAPNGEGDV